MESDETESDASTGTASHEVGLDLDVIEGDLADVEIALARLEAGTYRRCEVTGRPLPDELLAATPTARRVHGATSA